ncbi:MAG: hypothetical protein HFH03_12110 [Dorea sp.]|jgi:hypothetical protein|nr:hypothetical protein [Dorea sp.]
MYIISILAVIILSKFFTVGSGLFWPTDFFTLTLIVLFNFTLITSAGFLMDFNNAFRLSIPNRKHQESIQELKRAVEAVRLTIKTTLITGVFLFFFESAQIIMTLDLTEDALPSIGGMIMPGISAPIYSSAIILVLLPMESMLRLKLWNAQKAQEILPSQDPADDEEIQKADGE